MGKKTLSIRIEETMLERLQVVAAHEDRTPAGQVRVLIRDCVDRFERERAIARQRAMTLERQLEKAKK